MRIRRRPPLPLSPPEAPTNLSLQIPQPTQERKLHSSDGDRSVGINHGWILGTDPTPSDPPVLNEEKDPPPPPPSTLDAQVHNNERTGVEMARSTNAKLIMKERARSNAILLSNISTSSSTSPGNGTDNNNDDQANSYNVGKKVRRLPAVLMEGSRCSRVNGRGWRCSQQTLIGYSLCEHHLGKGRIRSISGGGGGGVRVGGQGLKSSSATRKPKKKEREKFGVVKARSMSSLLDEAGDNPADAMPPMAERNAALV